MILALPPTAPSASTHGSHDDRVLHVRPTATPALQRPPTNPTSTSTACPSTNHLSQVNDLSFGPERAETSMLTRTLASTSLLDEQRWKLPSITECPAGVINLPDASTIAATSGSDSVHDLASCSTGPLTELAFDHLGRSARAAFASPAADPAGSQDAFDTGTSTDRQVLTTPLSLGLGDSSAQRAEDSRPLSTRRSAEPSSPPSYLVPCNSTRYRTTRMPGFASPSV